MYNTQNRDFIHLHWKSRRFHSAEVEKWSDVSKKLYTKVIFMMLLQRPTCHLSIHYWYSEAYDWTDTQQALQKMRVCPPSVFQKERVDTMHTWCPQHEGRSGTQSVQDRHWVTVRHRQMTHRFSYHSDPVLWKVWLPLAVRWNCGQKEIHWLEPVFPRCFEGEHDTFSFLFFYKEKKGEGSQIYARETEIKEQFMCSLL